MRLSNMLDDRSHLTGLNTPTLSFRRLRHMLCKIVNSLSRHKQLTTRKIFSSVKLSLRNDNFATFLNDLGKFKVVNLSMRIDNFSHMCEISADSSSCHRRRDNFTSALAKSATCGRSPQVCHIWHRSQL